MSGQVDTKTVVLTGDLTIDWNLARSRGPEAEAPAWMPDVCSHVSWMRGGAALLCDLLQIVAAAEGYEIRQPSFPGKDGAPAQTGVPLPPAVTPEALEYHHSHASWMLHSRTTDKNDKANVWRIHELLGVNKCRIGSPQGDWAKVQNDDENAGLVVLDDAALGFSEDEALWPAALTTAGKTPRVLLKMARVGPGKLWQKLLDDHAERMIVIINAMDLRHREAQVSRELSWERTAQDLAWEITYNPIFNALARCAHVIVPFYADGAFLYSRGAESSSATYRLVFDRGGIEGEWARSRPGLVMGGTSSFTAAVARELMFCPAQPNIERGIQAGLSAIRALHSEGYGGQNTSAHDVKLDFPRQKVCEAITAGAAQPSFSSTSVRLPGLIHKGSATTGAGKLWTILEEVYPHQADAKAREVIEKGVEKALANVPIGKFGKLVTVDRQEIESLRTIGALISEYADQPRPRRPLSVAVFGPPGAGKSFGIKQLATSLRPDEIKVIEFNMSQFKTTAELVSALHQVRDAGLSQKLPLVFWDEFDSLLDATPFGWLRHFLAPMQDGTFQDDGMDHPIGRAIFVFAGGTSSRYQDFGKPRSAEEKDRRDEEERLKTLKVPDFISRLKGFLNVLGPNPNGSVLDDPFYILRRAILLRSMLGNYEAIMKDGAPQIDPGLLNAFLHTRRYRHGSRSIETLIACSRLSGRNKFERSSLPPEDQLELNVEARDFIGRLSKLEFTGDLLEKMARAAHQMFCESLHKEGWTYGEPEDKVARKHPNLKPYDGPGGISDELRESNRGQVRDIPTKLAAGGYDLLPDRTGSTPREFPPQVVEKLAIMEHARWMREKAENGWSYCEVRDTVLKTNPCMLPWSEEDRKNHQEYIDRLGPSPLVLSDAEKKKDLDAIRSIPTIVALAGFKVVGGDEEKK
jgi:hypothetical protein